MQIVVVGLGFLAAGGVKGATGLGYSTSALPVLTLAVRPHTAMPLVLFPALASNLTVMIGAGHFRSTLRRFILPGVVSGALFAFVTSFDEVVTVIFLAGYEQQTIPRQMWAGIREQISPTILAVATTLVLLSIALLVTIELLRRRSERLRGRKA
jgi:putative spermidine/putrescine transport system permease protein